MATVTTNYFRQQVLNRAVNFSTDTFQIRLMGSYVLTASVNVLKAVTTWPAISTYEVTGTNYSPATISGTTTGIVGNNVYWDGNNITWENVSFTTYGLAIVRTSDNMVMGFIETLDEGNPITVTNGRYYVTWDANGILNLI